MQYTYAATQGKRAVYLCAARQGMRVIRESVDSLCRDGADTDTPIFEMKRIRTPEHYSHKPFQTHNKLYECFSTIQDAQSV